MATISGDLSVRDVEYVRHGDRAMMLRFFRPDGPGPFPLVVVLHPGGWAHGDLGQCQKQGEAWAAVGFAVASLDFRQGGDMYPSSLVDINYAIRWLKARAPEFDIDPDRVALSGFSSGGHLAMLAAMRPFDARYTALPVEGADVDATVKCVAAAWPVINPLSRYRHTKNHLSGDAAVRWHEAAPEDYHRPQGIVDNHHLYWADEDEMAEGSPLLALERGETMAMPPALWVQGEGDIVHCYSDPDTDGDETEPERFARRYRDADGDIEILYVDYETKMGPPSFEPMAGFFRKHLE